MAAVGAVVVVVVVVEEVVVVVVGLLEETALVDPQTNPSPFPLPHFHLSIYQITTTTAPRGIDIPTLRDAMPVPIDAPPHFPHRHSGRRRGGGGY